MVKSTHSAMPMVIFVLFYLVPSVILLLLSMHLKRLMIKARYHIAISSSSKFLPAEKVLQDRNDEIEHFDWTNSCH